MSRLYKYNMHARVYVKVQRVGMHVSGVRDLVGLLFEWNCRKLCIIVYKQRDELLKDISLTSNIRGLG
jgi:hypothetical protein